MKYFSSFFSFVKNRLKLSAIFVIVIVLVGAWFLWGRGGNGNGGMVEINRGDISQVVSVTGNTKSKNNVDLSFDVSGRVTTVNYEVGDKVTAGEPIISLDRSQAYANVLSAEASLEYQRAKLGDAQTSLADAERVMKDVLRDAYTKADNVLYNTVDKFYNSPNSYSPTFLTSFSGSGTTLIFDSIDNNLRTLLSSGRLEVGQTMTIWKPKINDQNYLIDLIRASDETRTNLNKVRSLLDNLSLAVNSFSNPDYQQQSIISGFKTDIATARATIDAAISGLTSANQSYRAAVLAASTGRKGQLSTQDAQIKQAEANLAQYQAALDKLVMRAPFTGLITRQEAKVGETIQLGTPVVTLMSPDNFEIEVNVPEVDIGKVQVGQEVKITFDAFPGDEFKGKVYYVEPAETIVDGVVNYKVKVAISNQEGKLKNGLTANLDIITATRSNVLIVPQYAVTESDAGYSVKKVVNGEVVETPIKVGLRGRDGLLEVLSGLAEGDQVQNIGIKTK